MRYLLRHLCFSVKSNNKIGSLLVFDLSEAIFPSLNLIQLFHDDLKDSSFILNMNTDSSYFQKVLAPLECNISVVYKTYSSSSVALDEDGNFSIRKNNSLRISWVVYWSYFVSSFRVSNHSTIMELLIERFSNFKGFIDCRHISLHVHVYSKGHKARTGMDFSLLRES